MDFHSAYRIARPAYIQPVYDIISPVSEAEPVRNAGGGIRNTCRQRVQVLYILYFAFLCTLILSVFTRILDIWVLPQTPNWVVSLMLILGSVYIAQAR